MKSRNVTAHDVLDTLQAKLWTGDAYAWLYEVRNGTGWQKQARYADAVVVSCWPSRGIYFHGVEVKVSRSDWIHELKQPTKSDEIQRFCKYWWICVPPGIVQLAELPDAWGLIEVDPPKAYKVVRKAPELKPEPPTPTFVASMLRDVAKREKQVESRGYSRGLMKAQEEQAEAFLELEEQKKKLPDFSAREAEHARLKGLVEDFEHRSGINLTSRWNGTKHAAATTQLAKVLMDHGFPERVPDMLQKWRHDSEQVTQALEAAAKYLSPDPK